MDADIKLAKIAGASEHMTKPVKIQDLEQTLRSVLVV